MALSATESSLPPARLPALDRLGLTAIRAAECDKQRTTHLLVIARGIAELLDVSRFG